MFDDILKVTKSSFLKGMTFCRSKYVKKFMKLLAFIFEQPSYRPKSDCRRLVALVWLCPCCFGFVIVLCLFLAVTWVGL